MAHKAPSINTNFPADRCHFEADLSSIGGVDMDLTAISGKGFFAAQQIYLVNDSDSELSVTLQPEYGADFTVVVPPNDSYEVKIPVKTIRHTNAGALSALVYWWAGNLSNAFNR